MTAYGDHFGRFVAMSLDTVRVAGRRPYQGREFVRQAWFSTLLGQAEEVLPETVAVLRDGETVLDAQRASGGHLKAFSGHLAALTDSLRKGSRDLSNVLDRAPRAAGSVERLVDGVEPHLRPLLTHLIAGGQSVSARVSALRRLLIGYPAAVAGAFTVVEEDAADARADCVEPRDSRTGVRGARNAPPAQPAASISGLHE